MFQIEKCLLIHFVVLRTARLFRQAELLLLFAETCEQLLGLSWWLGEEVVRLMWVLLQPGSDSVLSLVHVPLGGEVHRADGFVLVTLLLL